MRLPVFAIAISIAVLSQFPQRAYPAAPSDVCLVLARNLKADTLEQGSSAEQFSQFQQLVASEKYEGWSAASSSSSSFNGSFSIPQEVDAAIGDSQTSNSNN